MKRIAVVEDEVYMREELCNMLQKDGYLAEAITEFEDAARLLAALRPDLVILDLNLPEISGFQICQELKNKTAIPVLVLTSRDQVKDELQGDAAGAVCLFTADDEGRAQAEQSEKPRARQNVVFEAGYFIGRLGRENVAILVDKGIEIPSDLQGVVYTGTDSWEFGLLKELKSMGYSIDFNKMDI